MRKTEASGWMVPNPSRALRRALWLAVIALGIGVVMTAGAARAQDDDEDDKTFEEKIIEGIMAGIGGTNMENRGIDYRERSPLVVPPKLDLPPPAASADVKAPNWPKDPDEARRKAAIAARKKENKDPARFAGILVFLLSGRDRSLASRLVRVFRPVRRLHLGRSSCRRGQVDFWRNHQRRPLAIVDAPIFHIGAADAGHDALDDLFLEGLLILFVVLGPGYSGRHHHTDAQRDYGEPQRPPQRSR